jgi:hypothetical protein
MQQHRNGHSQGSEVQQGPSDELDMYGDILRQSNANPLLEKTNLGQGNYDTDYLWQQVRSYRKGLFAYIAFSGVLSKRAIHETKIKLAREGFSHWNDNKGVVEEWDPLDEDAKEDGESIWTAERRRGNEIWNKLSDNRTPLSEKQAAALLDKTNVSEDFMPIFWEMAAGRHEVSRSKDAELLRDMLTGIKHLRSDPDGNAAALLGDS